VLLAEDREEAGQNRPKALYYCWLWISLLLWITIAVRHYCIIYWLFMLMIF